MKKFRAFTRATRVLWMIVLAALATLGLNAQAGTSFGFPTSTVLTASAIPATFGQTVTLTAKLAYKAPPLASMVFKEGSTVLGSAIAYTSGVYTLNLSTLSVGTHNITARYAGDLLNQPSTSAVLALTINAAYVPPPVRTSTNIVLTSTPNPPPSMARIEGRDW